MGEHLGRDLAQLVVCQTQGVQISETWNMKSVRGLTLTSITITFVDKSDINRRTRMKCTTRTYEPHGLKYVSPVGGQGKTS